MGCALKGLGPVLPSQSTFKNFRSEVFLSPMWGGGSQKNQLKTGKKKQKIVLLKNVKHLAIFLNLKTHTHINVKFVLKNYFIHVLSSS